MTLTVAVLIPAHNEESTIRELVRAVLDQPYPISQVIVVADSCTDRTADVAREAGATLVLETTFKDKAANQNAALPHVTADVIAGFDGDSRPEPDCISLMVADLERGYDATCSSILPLQDTGFFIEARRFAYSLGSQWWRLCQRRVGRIQVLTGASYAFRTEVVRAVGGFPNGLISADMDITWKLHEHGYKTWYTDKALTLTIDPATWKEYKAQMPRWAAGYFQNVARYRRLMLNWRSLLVVGTALFDLVTLWWWVVVVMYNLVTWQHLSMFRYMGYWFIVHTTLTMYLVSRVVGWKKAMLGFWPYTILNFYNKYLYTRSMFREWLLGRHYACVDAETQALTPQGWRSHNELADGDLIATYDAATDTLGWEPATLSRYNVTERLVSVEQLSSSQRLTDKHRMLVWTEEHGTHVRLAKDAAMGCEVPLAASWSPQELEGPGETRAALLGWFVTEGRRDGDQAVISLSGTVDAHHCQAIRDLLGAEGADWTELRPDQSVGASPTPGDRGRAEFVVTGAVAQWLTSVVPAGTLTYDVIFGWPQAECRALLDALVNGGGTRRNSNAFDFVRGDRAEAEKLQCLAIRCGLRARVRPRRSDGAWLVYVSTKRWVRLRGGNGDGSGSLPRETYDGVVWCPTVRTGFWLARRSGMPFITGNSWTGRTGRKTVITPMTTRRRFVLGQLGAMAGAIVAGVGNWLGNTAMLVAGVATAVVIPLSVVRPRSGGGQRVADAAPLPDRAGGSRSLVPIDK
ncbi:glycosyltransferase family 2 protein [Streptomyces sp. AK02-04a]|uniref:glycosyltransferase n=1 Tax=Streptomyces sp. AK02-04a TaxID=3028649 RepID=UPI0029A879B6|nr:glycosyltransferase family 2 protein [Streptomyces sp. AK02-04a]MDX3763606.1 glycosyltransferase family 2 protein [Streptomyces sp. AK02-04a]